MTDQQQINLTAKELAARWHMTPAALAAWRRGGKGPDYIKFSRKALFYPLSAVEQYERAHLQQGSPA